MAALEGAKLASKFRGCLVGALLGDCLGAVYEGEEEISKLQVQNYFHKLDGPYVRAPYKPYTDDTAMTRSVAESLIENRGFDEVDMAKRFVRQYFLEPNRGYGANVVSVFNKLRGSKFVNPYGPSRDQFDGMGSYGNGAAMRISPVALYCYNNIDNLIDTALKSSELTHSHKLGKDGAVLQCLAVRKGLMGNPDEPLNVMDFASELIHEMSSVEKDDDDLKLFDKFLYQKQLNVMKDLLAGDEAPSEEMVVNKLGNNISALMSVPTAIYCFLRAQKDIPGVNTDNPFRRSIQYAITLGGDTDTIASMAGAIAGSYYGEEMIGQSLKQHCEAVDYVTELANKLYEVTNM